MIWKNQTSGVELADNKKAKSLIGHWSRKKGMQKLDQSGNDKDGFKEIFEKRKKQEKTNFQESQKKNKSRDLVWSANSIQSGELVENLVSLYNPFKKFQPEFSEIAVMETQLEKSHKSDLIMETLMLWK